LHTCLHAIASKFDALHGYVKTIEDDHKAAADAVKHRQEAVKRGFVVDDRRESDLEGSVSADSDSE
jgi:hypothetical protein